MSRKLRVLHVGKFYPPHRGGMESHLQTLCKKLTKLVDLTVLVSNTASQSVAEEIDGFRLRRLGRVAEVAATSLCPGLIAELRQSDADIVHLHLPNPAAVLAYLVSGQRGKLVITYHSDVLRQRLLAACFQPFLKRILNGSAAIIAASPNYVESSSVLRQYRKRCTIVPFGIDFDGFDSVDASMVAKVRRTYGDRMVIAVGRMVSYKGFQHLIEAMALIDAHLVLIGDGPLRASLQQLVERLGISAKVSIRTGVEDLAPFYHAAQLFVLPSIARTEAFGIVQLEAMACSKPVVNTNLASGVPFVSPDGVTGRTVSPGNTLELASAIAQLLDDDGLRRRLGIAARQRVEKEFSAAVMVSRTMQVYQDITAGGPARIEYKVRTATAGL